MAVPPQLQLDMIRGDTASFTAPVVRSSAPLDVTGAIFWFTAKKNHLDPDNAAIIRCSLGDGITVNAPASAGILTITIAAAKTAGIPSGPPLVLVWDLQMLEASGTVTTVANGTLTVYMDVTNAII